MKIRLFFFFFVKGFFIVEEQDLFSRLFCKKKCALCRVRRWPRVVPRVPRSRNAASASLRLPRLRGRGGMLLFFRRRRRRRILPRRRRSVVISVAFLPLSFPPPRTLPRLAETTTTSSMQIASKWRSSPLPCAPCSSVGLRCR